MANQKHPFFTGLRLERAQSCPRFGADARFHNTGGQTPQLEGETWPVVRDFVFRSPRRRPTKPLPVENPTEVWRRPLGSGLRLTWLGHSTVLIEIDGVRVLTDPVFGERVSPVSFAGPKRFHRPPVTLRQLPPLDAVLLSHDHFDHLCATSMRTLGKLGVPIITALGVGARLEALGLDPRQIVELDWWESHTLPGGGAPFYRHARAALLGALALGPQPHALVFVGDDRRRPSRVLLGGHGPDA